MKEGRGINSDYRFLEYYYLYSYMVCLNIKKVYEFVIFIFI